MAVGELAARLPVSRPAVSQHLKVLKEARLVRDQARGHAPHLRRSIRPGSARSAPGSTDILGQGARRLCRGGRKGGKEMNVEAQRISPAPIRKIAAGQGEPGESVRHLRRRHGQLVARRAIRCSSRRRRTCSSSRAPAAAGTRSARTAASRAGARCSAGNAPDRVLLAWQLNADWSYDPEFETDGRSPLHARRRPYDRRFRASRPRAVRRQGRSGAGRL